jgi:hypothetical protein
MIKYSQIFGISTEVYIAILVLFPFVYLFWRWLLKKTIKDNARRSIATWIVSIISTPVLYFGLVSFLFFLITYYPHREFTKERWIDFPEKRYELTDDIISKNIFIGKTKREIINLLADSTIDMKSNYWYYEVGYRPELFNIDPSTLEIDFKEDKVVSVHQHH